MKKIFNKTILLLLLSAIATVTQAQILGRSFIFKITNPPIINAQPPSLYGHINHIANTTTLGNNTHLLFQFENSALGKMAFYYREESGLLQVRMTNPGANGHANMYNLFYTKVRLREGANVLKLVVYNDLIWITCNPGSEPGDVVENNETGEGILWYNDLALFHSSNFSKPDRRGAVKLIDEQDLLLRVRHSTDLYYQDRVYDAYGYGNEDFIQPVQLGNGLDFDGINDVVALPNGNFPGWGSSYTLEAWIKPDTQDTIGIMRWGRAAPVTLFNGLSVIGSDSILWNFFDGGNHVNLMAAAGNLADGAWHHIAAVFNGSTRSIYVDGLLRGQDNLNADISLVNVTIGSNYFSDNYKGKIDEVRIWNIARTQADIQGDMHLAPDSGDVGIIAYYSFDQGTVCGTNTGITTLPDMIGANTGTLYNFGLTGAASNWCPGVTPPSYDTLCVGNTLQIDNYTEGGTWTSTNSSIAAVDANGIVTAIAPGAVTINYTITYASGCTAVSPTFLTVNDVPSAASIFGNGLNFDGTDDYVNINNSLGNFGTGDFTVELDFRTTSSNTFLISKRSICNHDNFWNLAINASGQLRAELDETAWGTNYVDFSGTTVVNDGNWHHAALVRKSGTVMLYLDGVLEATASSSANLNNSIVLQLGISVCNDGQNTTQKFTGTLDELRIWNTARTVAQLQAGMNAELAGIEPGLLAYYNFNQGIADSTNTGINTLNDKTVNNNDGTLANMALAGATSNWVAGAVIAPASSVSNGLNFDGVNDYVRTAAPVTNNLSQFTMEGWIKPNALTAIQSLFGHNDVLEFWLNGGQFNFWSPWTGPATANSGLSAGQWSHIAVTGDGAHIKFYVDGNLVGSMAASTSTYGSSTSPLTVGGSVVNCIGCPNPYYFAGVMDDVRIWNIARTQAQIQSAMYRELWGDEAGLLAYYDFNNGSAGSSNAGNIFLTDETENYNDGTLVNFALTGTTSNWVSGNVANEGVEVCAGGTVQLNSNGSTGTWVCSDGNIATVSNTGLVTGISGGTATITFINENSGGCTTNSSTIVRVNQPVLAQNTGNALSFDGVNDYVRINNNITASFTLEAYIKTSATSRTGVEAWQGNPILWADVNTGVPNDFVLSVLNNKIMFDDGYNNRSLGGSITITDGQWHHIAITRQSGGNLTLYVDGVGDTTAPAGTAVLNANPDIIIGGNTLNGWYFNGLIDEVRIWDTVLTQEDILNNMTMELTGKEPNLIDYYNFNEGFSGGANSGITTLTDNSTGGNNSGTLNNFALTGASSNWVASGVVCDNPSFCSAGTIQLNNATPGGTWASSNTAVATVTAVGMVTATGTGTANISYTVTSPTGCSNTTITEVDVNLQPSLPGNTGNGLSLDGINDYVAISNMVTSSFTLEAYINTSVASPTGWWAWQGSPVIWSDVSGNTNDFNLSILNNKIAFDDGDGYPGLLGNIPVTDGEWHHIAITREAGINTKIYVDGVLDNSGLAGTAVLNANPNILFGGNTVDGRYFNGLIDEVRIWNTALSQSQIQQNMQTELSSIPAGLLAYYKMNAGVAAGNNTGLNSVSDVTSNGHTGVLYNMALTGSYSNWVAGAATTVNAMICVGDTFQLNNESWSGTWSSSNTSIATVSSDGLVAAVGTGTATISFTGISAANCMASVSTTINNSNCSLNKRTDGNETSARNVVGNNMFAVYPNPNIGSFTVSFNLQEASPVTLRLVDVQGKTIYHEEQHATEGNNQYKLNTDLPGGMYLLQVSTAEFSGTVKLVVEK